MSTERDLSITGLILAGGQSRRMGGQDKGLALLADQPLVVYVLKRLLQQLSSVTISANRNQEHYSQYGWPVIEDKKKNFCGPLAGIVSAMEHCQTEYLLSVPCDAPFFPKDLTDRLTAALVAGSVQISVAHDGERLQPAFALWHCGLLADLSTYLASGGRKIDSFFTDHPFVIAEFSTDKNAFININTKEDLAWAQTQVK